MIGETSVVDLSINLVLALIMLGLGLSLTFQDFKNLFRHPKSLFTALGIQLLVVPAIAFLLAVISGQNDSVKVGIVLVSLCASGASSNLITHLFKGNVALAISMTSINSFITLATIPLLTSLAMNFFIGKDASFQLPVWHTVAQIFLVTIVPAIIGILVKRRFPNFAGALEKPLKYILTLLLALVFTVKIFFGESSGGTGITFAEVMQLLPYLLSLNVLAMLVGFFISGAFKLPFADRYTVSIEVSLHNTALALLIGGNILHNPEIEKPAVVYAMFSFFTAVIFVYFIKRFFSKRSV